MEKADNMNTLTKLDPVTQTMSHKQIATLVDSHPDDVKSTMDRLEREGIINITPIAKTQVKGITSRTVTNYHVYETDSYIVVAHLCRELTVELVFEWQALKGLA